MQEREDTELAGDWAGHSDALPGRGVVDRTGGGAVAPPARQVVALAVRLCAAPGLADTEVESATCEVPALEDEGKHALLVNINSAHCPAGLLLLLQTRAGGGGDGCCVDREDQEVQLLNNLI